MTKDDTRGVSQLIGAGLRRARLAQGLRQEDVAERMSRKGVSWSQTTTAKVESGQRSVTIEEFVVLAYVLGVPYKAFFEDEGDSLIELGRAPDTGAPVVVACDDLAAIFSGKAAPVMLVTYQHGIPALSKDEGSDVLGRFGSLPHEVNLSDARLAAKRPAERRMARRLGIPAVALSVLAHGFYGRSLTDERDGRLASINSGDRDTAAARGWVTRSLAADFRVWLGMEPEED